MTTRRVSVLDPSGAKKTQVEVPDNVEVHRLVNGLVKRMGLPQTGQDGRPISYRLTRIQNNQEEELATDQTLLQAGVQDNDVLRLYADMRAG